MAKSERNRTKDSKSDSRANKTDKGEKVTDWSKRTGSSEKRAKVKEYMGNLVVLNKLQGSLLTHLKRDLKELGCG